jgi:hypothetical protein
MELTLNLNIDIFYPTETVRFENRNYHLKGEPTENIYCNVIDIKSDEKIDLKLDKLTYTTKTLEDAKSVISEIKLLNRIDRIVLYLKSSNALLKGIAEMMFNLYKIGKRITNIRIIEKIN